MESVVNEDDEMENDIAEFDQSSAPKFGHPELT